MIPNLQKTLTSLLVALALVSAMSARCRAEAEPEPEVGVSTEDLSTEAADALDDEMVGFLGSRTKRSDSEEAAQNAGGSFGFRGGLMLSGDSKQDGWERTAILGFFLRPGKWASERMAYEFGLDTASVKRADGFVTSHLYMLKAEVLFLQNGGGRGTSAFLTAGAGVGFGEDLWEADGGQGWNTAGALMFGGGIGPGGRSWDVRANYQLYLGSTNVLGSMIVSVGSTF